MALGPDDLVCFCFHVPLRKVESFCRVERPRAASQISECLSAGTGCGWCVPMLRKIHGRMCGVYRPWWREEPEEAYHSPERDASAEMIDFEAYAAGRQRYLAETGRRPPEGAATACGAAREGAKEAEREAAAQEADEGQERGGAEVAMEDVTLAVLAGGEGSRMGRPKGLLRVGRRAILEHLLERFGWRGPTLLVTAPGREHPPGWERFSREAADPVAGVGPLRGILTALESASTRLVAVTTVDMPWVEAEQVMWLARALRSSDGRLGVMAEHEDQGARRIEPFPAVFEREARGRIGEDLERGVRSVRTLAEEGVVMTVRAPAEWPERVWLNLNRPEELERFERELGACSKPAEKD